MASDIGRYVDAQGRIFSLTADDAKRLGYQPYKPKAQAKAQSAPPENKMVGGAENKGG